MLCWNVYYGNFNKREIQTFNIFDHVAFYESCVKAKKKFKEDREGFANEVRSSLQYYFWSKCEWEIVLTHWPDGELYQLQRDTTLGILRELFDYGDTYEWMRPEREVTIKVYPKDYEKHPLKIDVYEQVMNNWDVFIDYLWNNRKELKARRK